MTCVSLPFTLRRSAPLVFLAMLACKGGDSLTRYGVTPDPTASAYRVRSLVGALAGVSSTAHDINTFGDVVGVSDRHPVRWVIDGDRGSFGPFSLLLADNSDPGPGEARAISDRGLIVGWLAGPPVRPFVWSEGGGVRELELPPGLNAGVAYDVNRAGQVVGSGSVDPEFLQPEEGRVLLWDVDLGRDTVAVQDLGTFGGVGARGLAINGDGQIVGIAWHAGGQPLSTFIWSEGSGVEELPFVADVLGLNDRGEVVGGWSDRAAVWAGGSVEAVGPPGSFARAVSDFGHIVGEIAGARPDDPSSAFLLRDGELIVLEGLSALDQGRPRSVNGVGVIVGENYIVSGGMAEAAYWLRR